MARRKVYLPKWQRYYLVPLFVGLWLFITYLEFFSGNTEEQLGWVGYIFMTALFLGMGSMMWLMTTGKLPAYIMEDEEPEPAKKKSKK